LQELTLNARFYLVADAYYANRTIIRHLRKANSHLISRMRSNAVAYYPATTTRRKGVRGRNRKYGRKIRLKRLSEQVVAHVLRECLFDFLLNSSGWEIFKKFLTSKLDPIRSQALKAAA
jgi:hypothetical protein